ncbi:L domain-like protein [Exidia glandulosa HHB12029]|uniref:L domain-like protein n=1 Tax=Exidia glandulosa HHB12029 TaxID=1314781 RepID=A0A165FRN7_EXIGL|nr:L domain-like protein [Exidia glandulosa HHB12029]
MSADAPRPSFAHSDTPSYSVRASPASQTVHLPAPEISQFSPASQEFPIDASPSKAKWIWGSPRSADVERGFEDPRSKPLPKKARRKVSDILFRWRVGFFNHRPQTSPAFDTWGPPADWKTSTATTLKPIHPQKQRSWVWLGALALLLLFFFANIVYIDIRLANGSLGTTIIQSGAVDSATSLTPETTACMFQYNLSAPFLPKTFPCDTCLPRMQALPTAYAASHAEDAQIARESVQFCGLHALFAASGDDGSAALEKVGWMQDNRYCTWSGVSCDGTGSVTSVEMVFPAVPATIPDEMGALTSLLNITLIGNGAVPSGALPNSLARATELTTLHLERTALTGPLDDVLLAGWPSLRTLELISNSKMGTTLPYYIGQNSLETLVVQEQGLSEFLVVGSTILTSSLTTLDLSSNALTGPVPPLLSAFMALQELRLSGNDLTGPLPDLPAGLQTLDIDHNPHFGDFTLPVALCTSHTVVECDMRATAFANTTSCGFCKF